MNHETFSPAASQEPRSQRDEHALATSRDRLGRCLAATGRFAEATAEKRTLLDTIAGEVGRTFEAYAAIALPTEDGTHLDVVAAFTPHEGVVVTERERLGARVALGDDVDPLACVYRSVAPHRGEDLVAVPLRARGTVIGVLFVHQPGRERGLGAADIEVLQMLADHAALAITNARLLEEMKGELDEHRRTREALERSEENFRRAQRMEAVGRLAGGVAHDFNNVLSVVLSYGEILMEGLHKNDPMHDELEQIVKAGRRAAELTRQLLAFSRKQVLAPRVVDLGVVVDGVGKMLRRLLGEDVELRIVTQARLHPCCVDAGQMEQVILNLVVNARDAMLNGGRLVIETRNVDLDEAYVREHPDACVGPHVCLSVTDTGVGMTADVLARLFEPFFTTKPKGAGTGLGLAMVYGVVKQSGGTVSVHSEPGRGTRFEILLPVVRGTATSLAPATPGPRALGGTETILVVEDEPQVRELVRGVLARQGYDVLVAENGGEALLICEQHGARIDLLLTDVVMPRLSGRQLADRLRPLRPDMRVLYMSGYAEGIIVHHGVLESNVDFLPKPLTRNALLDKVRGVLDRVTAA